MIGFFGGTFDPIHLGHINLAIELKEKAGLSEVWFCPTFESPFKTGIQSASGQDRLKMAKLGLKSIPFFKILNHEIIRGGPSYTIDTIRALKLETNKSFRLILGEDQIEHFSKWKAYEELKKLAPPLVGRRYPGPSDEINLQGFEIVNTALFDISASKIRQRVKSNLYINHLVPEEVANYILNKGLYTHAKTQCQR